MSVKKEANGRRSISVEVEVPGTPEEVWDAIATGPGISKWFVPADVEPRVGGKVVHNFGPGIRPESTIFFTFRSVYGSRLPPVRAVVTPLAMYMRGKLNACSLYIGMPLPEL